MSNARGSELDLDQPWRIGEESFSFIREAFKSADVKSLLEFGGGASTIRFALELPELRIVTAEHDSKFFAITARYIDAYSLHTQVYLLCCPLSRVWIDYRSFTTYEPPTLAKQFDAILVDGPPGSTMRGREACLYYGYDRLKVGGLVLLDDMERRNEETVMRNWLLAYPDSFESMICPLGHGVAVLMKTRHLAGRAPVSL